jgi:hypothetical protein
MKCSIKSFYGTTRQASQAGVPDDPRPSMDKLDGQAKLPLTPSCGKDIERPE